jgi:predicted patatin/cPLA2 family phospholipase
MHQNKKYALAVQGGGQKGAFAAGVLDKFKKENFDPFSLYLGTSAGALNVASFVAGQPGLGLDFILNYTTRERFFDFNKFVKKEQPMDLDWAFELVNSGDFPLDIEKGRQNLGTEKQALACITNVDEVKDYYYPMFSEDWFDVMRATCAIPMLYFRDIEFDGAKWVDGGVTATIPAEEAYRRGFKDIVVITTSPIVAQSTDKAPPPVEASAVDELQEAPLARFRQELEEGLTPYIEKYKLHGHKEKLLDFQKQFSNKINELSQDIKLPSFDSVTSEWLPEKEKLSQLLAQQQQRLLQKASSNKNMDMLVQHYMNHNAARQFIHTPPEGVNMFEIAPSVALKSKGLMSSKSDILHDYEVGLLAGKEFLERFKQMQPSAECITKADV